jgi:anti-anti-sigma factor
MEIKLQSLEPHLVCLRCRGSLGRPNSDVSGRDPLEEILGVTGRGANILLNMQQTDRVESTGLAWLVSWHHRTQEAGGSIGLCAVPPRLADVLRLCGLDQVFSIWPDENAARAALGLDSPDS